MNAPHPVSPTEDRSNASLSGMMSRLRAPLKLVAGFALLFVGAVLALPGVPGPGILIIVLGLLLLSERFLWARRLLAWSRVKLRQIRRKERGKGGHSGNGQPRASTET